MIVIKYEVLYIRINCWRFWLWVLSTSNCIVSCSEKWAWWLIDNGKRRGRFGTRVSTHQFFFQRTPKRITKNFIRPAHHQLAFTSSIFSLSPLSLVLSLPRAFQTHIQRHHASDVHPRRQRQPPLHPQEGRARPGHQVGAPCALLPRRQVVSPARHAEAPLHPAPDAAE